MKINTKKFIDDYITNPLAKDISVGERILSLAFSIILAPLTLGILHIRSAIMKRRPISNINQERQLNFKQVEQNNEKSSLFKPIVKTHQLIGEYFNKNATPSDSANPTANLGETQSPIVPSIESYKAIQDIEKSGRVGEIVNTFISNFYMKPLPPKEEVIVPFKDKNGTIVDRKWAELTREEKIQVNNNGTHAHNQISLATPEDYIDQSFFPHQNIFLKSDPRKSHGNDHCARAAIFSVVFAYLYAKYHPKSNINSKDIILCQIVAAGHDSARQSEGPDVYDEKSAENTLKILKSLGIRDDKILKDCRDAIADKDNEDLKSKSFIAKCVQNADSAEFVRLLLNDRVQDSIGFDNSRQFLDIFREFKEMNDAGQEALQYGFTFKDFCFELDALRKEMNEFIYITHKEEFREKISLSNNYYQEMLNQITPVQFPLLNSVLEQVSVKQAPNLKSMP